MLGMLLYLYRTFQKGSKKAPYMDLDTITILTLCKTVRMHECTQRHGAGFVPCVLCPLVFALSLIVGKCVPSSFLLFGIVLVLALDFECNTFKVTV